MSACNGIWSFPNEEHHNLPNDKIPLLKNNDIIYYQDSATSKLDTFKLNIDDIWGQTQEGNYFRYITIFYNKITTSTTFLRINITSAAPDGAIFGYNYYSVGVLALKIKTNFTLNGITYPTVYITNLPPDATPNTVYFTYKNGIIRYEYKDGRVYNLVSK